MQDKVADCVGKVVYPDFGAAQRAARVVSQYKQSRRAAGKGLHAYKCPFCSAYHVGSFRRKSKARRNA